MLWSCLSCHSNAQASARSKRYGLVLVWLIWVRQNYARNILVQQCNWPNKIGKTAPVKTGLVPLLCFLMACLTVWKKIMQSIQHIYMGSNFWCYKILYRERIFQNTEESKQNILHICRGLFTLFQISRFRDVMCQQTAQLEPHRTNELRGFDREIKFRFVHFQLMWQPCLSWSNTDQLVYGGGNGSPRTDGCLTSLCQLWTSLVQSPKAHDLEMPRLLGGA